MTVFASGGFHGLCVGSETVFGTSPATMTKLRHTSCSLILNKDTFQSGELRDDRQITDFRHGTKRVSGNIGFEMSYAEFDSMLQAVLCGTWQVAYAKTGADIGAQGAPNNQFYATATTFTSIATGDLIAISGFTGTAGLTLNAVHRVTAHVAKTLTVSTSLVTKAVGATVSVTRQPSLLVGTTQRSFTIEREFGDIVKYQIFTGCVINTLSLSVKPNAIVTGEFGILGKGSSATSTPVDSDPTASQTNSPYDSFTGAISEGGSAVGYVTSIDLKLDNGGDPTFVIGDDETPAIVLSRSNVSGSLEVYFQNLTMLNKFENETTSSIEFYLGSGDVGGSSYRFYLPNVKYGSGDNSVSDENPITLKMDYQALYSTTDRTNLRITKIA
jgi:hypothetical protein